MSRYTNDQRGYFLRLPGFYSLNAYIWTARDHMGRSNLSPGERLWYRRLRMLVNHFLPVIWWRRRKVFRP